MASRLNFGIVFEGEIQEGGGFQQQLSTILDIQKTSNCTLTFYVFSDDNKRYLASQGLDVEVISKVSLIGRFLRFIVINSFVSKFGIRTHFECRLKKNHIDLVYFLSPSALALELVEHNFVFTNWDLCHRDHPEFPEVNFMRQFERRELLYGTILKKAVAILVDSELGKRNIIRRYGVDESRLYIAPFTPSINVGHNVDIDVVGKYEIVNPFIFYPAQFWAHKNHVYIIDAILILNAKGIKITAVFSGSNKGNLNHVLEYGRRNNVEEQIRYIGFAPDDEIYSLYKKSVGLVMPSYFGPTNIPPLEAFSVGTPVLYSNLEGLRDQVQGAALLFDLSDPSDLAAHLEKLIGSPELRAELVKKGRLRLAELTTSSVLCVLEKILRDYEIKMKCWRLPDLEL